MNQEALDTLKKEALENHIPIIMDDTLEIIKKERPKRILEIGTAVGYSASCFAKASDEDCLIDTIELDEERAKQAVENINNIGFSSRINVIVGNAVEILPTINNSYDIIFIDANKGKYPFFLQEGIRLCKDKGLILADNILYKGYVMSDYNKHKQRTAVRHLREYIDLIKNNKNLESDILEIGDGLAITRVSK